MCMYVYIIHVLAWRSIAGQQMDLLPKWAENTSSVMLQLIKHILQQESLKVKLYITLSPFHGSLFLLDQARSCGIHVKHASLGLFYIAHLDVPRRSTLTAEDQAQIINLS